MHGEFLKCHLLVFPLCGPCVFPNLQPSYHVTGSHSSPFPALPHAAPRRPTPTCSPPIVCVIFSHQSPLPNASVLDAAVSVHPCTMKTPASCCQLLVLVLSVKGAPQSERNLLPSPRFLRCFIESFAALLVVPSCNENTSFRGGTT